MTQLTRNARNATRSAAIRQESFYFANEFRPGWIMCRKHMIFAIERDEPCSWDRCGEQPALLKRDERVAQAMKDDRRYSDLRGEVQHIDVVDRASQLQRILR